ncbi:MAG: hypothetical protein JST30_08655 [Armatimonadetes bacterium]|nr:hypothetical protein [Armatimonadota bacterium]
MSIVAALLVTSLLGCQSLSKEQQMDASTQKIVEWMKKTTGSSQNPTPSVVMTEGLKALMPGVSVQAVHYREFPVQAVPKSPMAVRSVFLVDKSGKVALFTKREDFAKAFVARVAPVGSEGQARDLALGYARASAEFSQDGFFKFTVQPENVIVKSASGSLTVTAKVPVVEKGGDTGSLVSTLTFAVAQGGKAKLTAVRESDTIKPGVRPICQCTLLLDKNPIVRKMAERDLLVMGKDAWPYVEEQMALASPELRREIERVWRRILNGER